MYQNFINEIFGSYLSINAHNLLPYIPRIQAVLQGIEIKDEKEPLKLGLFDQSLNQIKDVLEGEDPSTEKAVAILPIRGMLTKYGSWWDYGAEDYAQMMDEAYADESIQAIILQFHSHGGSVHAVFPFEEVLKRRNKPVLAVIDSVCMSAVYYTACLTDGIYAVNRMAEVGSIGVMAQLTNQDKWMKDIGIEVIEIIPPESKWKNKAYREAKNGKPSLLIKEELSPWAINFQDVVKANRPNLDLGTEGIIEGRTFYAYDGVDNGLVDEILTMPQIIEKAFEFKNEEISKLFN